MATIIATAGATDANCYVTLADAEVFLETQLHDTAWSGATDPTKTNALIEASRFLDETSDWVGSIADSSQAMRWPRSGVYDPDGRALANDVVPAFLANATALFALYLIKSDRVSDRSDLGVDSVAVSGAVNVRFSKSDKKKLVPDAIYNMVAPYARTVRGRSASVPVYRS